MPTGETSPPVTPGEQETHSRLIKKPKHAIEEGCILEEMEVQVDKNIQQANMDPREENWASRLFPVTGGSLEDQRHYYMGEDDKEKFDGVDEIFRTTEEATPPKFGPKVEISKEKYVSLFVKWRGALIIKLLGKTISYRVLDQRIHDLWNLDKGYELTDLEEGFFIVRFFSRPDYLHVLEGGPWIILGHYLMVSKWRPKF